MKTDEFAQKFAKITGFTHFRLVLVYDISLKMTFFGIEIVAVVVCHLYISVK